MPTAYETFINDYPECSGLPEGAVTRSLTLAALMLSKNTWGKYYAMALPLYAAHALSLEYDLTAACAALGKKSPQDIHTVSAMSASASSLSQSFAVSASSTSADPVAAWLSRSRYGMALLLLMEVAVPAGGIVYSPDTSESTQRGRL